LEFVAALMVALAAAVVVAAVVWVVLPLDL
jgi:hypothetical protein